MTAAAKFKVFPNLYKDSVTLMQLGAKLRAQEGIAEASCIMATPANLEQLRDADLAIDVAVAASDLLVVVRGEPDACDEAIAAAGTMLQSSAMGPKVEAILRFVQARPGGRGIITNVESIARALAGQTGTSIGS